MNNQLTWERLKGMLPLLNTSELERRAGLRPRRLYDVKIGKSSLSEDELSRIENTLRSSISL